MTEHPVAQRLRQAQALSNSLRDVLRTALTLAWHHDLEFNHVAAINRAVADANTAWLHIANIATSIDLVPTPLPFSKRQAIVHPGP